MPLMQTQVLDRQFESFNYSTSFRNCRRGYCGQFWNGESHRLHSIPPKWDLCNSQAIWPSSFLIIVYPVVSALARKCFLGLSM
jgi:hypothetical protein